MTTIRVFPAYVAVCSEYDCHDHVGPTQPTIEMAFANARAHESIAHGIEKPNNMPKPSKFYIDIKDAEDTVVETVGPYDYERIAERAALGVQINLHDDFYTEIREEAE